MHLRQSGLTSRRVGDDVVVLDLEQSRYLSLAGSGAVLYELLQQDCKLDDLVATLLERYEVDEQTARRDVEAFVEQLQQANLLAEAEIVT